MNIKGKDINSTRYDKTLQSTDLKYL